MAALVAGPLEFAGLLALGAAAGLAAYRLLRQVSLAPLAIPALALARSLLPLLLPLFAVLAVGLFKVGWLAMLGGVAVLTAVAARLLVWPERRQLLAAIRLDRRDPASFAILIVLGLAIGLTGLFGEGAAGRSLRSIGDLASIALGLALALWALAFALRLGFYSASRLQAGVALFVVLSGLRLGAALGLAPFGEWIDAHAPFLDWALPAAAGLLILTEAVLDVWAVRREEDPHGTVATTDLPAAVVWIRGDLFRGRPVELLRGLGLAAAILAALALLLAGAVGLHETEQPGKRLSSATTATADEVRRQPPAPSGFGRDDMALARAYGPVLAFTRGERWTPVAVDGFVAAAKLRGPLTEPLPDPISVSEKLDRSCPRLSAAPCYRLTIECPRGDLPCAHGERHPGRGNDRLYGEGDVYVRVARLATEKARERRREARHVAPGDRWPPPVFAAEGPYADRLTILLQYWYFYYYDEWETHLLAGQLVQRHEADWEAVTIGLSPSRPLFVAYSAHCAGEWRPWDEVEVSRAPELPERSHPVVAVAIGSHANYAEASQKRSPDPGGCNGLPAGTTTALGYASNIRDKTEYGWQWYPAPGGFHLVDRGRPPMSFPGYWGTRDSTTFHGFFKQEELSHGNAPATPTEQPLWQAPVTKIFCGNYRQPSLPASLANYHCAKKG